MTKKNIILTLTISALALILIIGGIFTANRARKNTRSYNISANLTPEQRQEFESKIQSAQAIIHNPKSSLNDRFGAYLNMGINYESLGERDNEERAFIAASELEPTSDLPWSDLASLYVNESRYADATRAFQKALALGKTDAQLWEKYLDFNRYQLKLDGHSLDALYNRAIEDTNGDVNVRKFYASYLEDVGNINAAISQWKAILVLDPNDKAVQAEVQKLQAEAR